MRFDTADKQCRAQINQNSTSHDHDVPNAKSQDHDVPRSSSLDITTKIVSLDE
jgi:hypothetical protein